MKTDGLFHMLPDAHVVVSQKGVYRQLPVATRWMQDEHCLFFVDRGVYVQLLAEGLCSADGWRWSSIVLPSGALPHSGRYNRPTVVEF